MALYTVEQVELMRRLRLTGITTEQIIDAFSTLDRLDYELSIFSNHGPAVESGGSANSTTAGASIFGTAQITTVKALESPYNAILSRFQSGVNDIGNSPYSQLRSASGHHSRRKRSMPGSTFTQRVNQEEAAPGYVGDEEIQQESTDAWRVTAEQPLADERSQPAQIGQLGQINSEMQQRLLAICRPTRARRSHGFIKKFFPTTDYSQYIDDNQLDEFLTRDGEVEAIKQIKDFVITRQLRQQQIATMTGVSQPYVSRFLSGSMRDLSTRVRRVLYRWYLAVKNNPDLLSTPGAVPAEDNGPLSMVTTTKEPAFHFPDTAIQANEFHNLSDTAFSHSTDTASPQHPVNIVIKDGIRRDRFVFKPIHLRWLQKYFSLDPYPSVKKREEIAAACNKAYESNEGRFVLPREKLSAQIVGTWFSNRRKEQRRRGELKLRRFRRARHMVCRPGAAMAYRSVPTIGSQSSSSVANPPTANGSQTSAETQQNSSISDGVKREGYLANIVNELHAMNVDSNNVVTLGDYEGSA